MNRSGLLLFHSSICAYVKPHALWLFDISYWDKQTFLYLFHEKVKIKHLPNIYCSKVSWNLNSLHRWKIAVLNFRLQKLTSLACSLCTDYIWLLWLPIEKKIPKFAGRWESRFSQTYWNHRFALLVALLLLCLKDQTFARYVLQL